MSLLTPFFSIILPVYNRQHIVQKAIKSVLSQTYGNWELIIIDDGSTDESAKIIQQFNDLRIHYFYQVNQERSIARNNGIRRAKGEFICFLDSDDYYLEDHLERLFNCIHENKLTNAIFCTGAIIDRGDNKMEKLILYDGKSNALRHVFFNKLDMNTVCCHREILEEYKFDQKFRIGEDTHLWLRIVKRFPLIQVPFYTTCTVNHADSSIVQYYQQADLKLLDIYVKSAKDLFNAIDLRPDISKLEQRIYISKKYRAMARSCIWTGKFFGIFYCYFFAMLWNPSFVFSKESLNILRETMVKFYNIVFRRGKDS